MDPLEQRLGGSIRGRVAYAFDRIMPYFTAGFAAANFDVDHDGNDDTADTTMTGYAVGGGIEWAATDNIIVRAQYLFSDFGEDDFDFDGDVHQFEVKTQDVLVGVAYKF
jgi:outer membrane immunogenic protein